MSSQSIERSELLSALADGQVDDAEFGAAMDMLAADAGARASWHSYHLVGDLLRQTDLAVHAGDGSFVARFQTRLAAELQASRPAPTSSEVVAMAPALQQRPSANESQFRWKLVAALASVLAVASVSWTALGPRLGGGEALAPQLAQANPPPKAGASVVAVAGPGQQVMIRDPRLDQLLAAHKQFGGTSALQMPAGFLRNATYEEPSR
jgi:sigma-E factor negative regulatory protein RseA